mgnify:CR=1 FL=1|jgi:hypothetical protein
MLGNDGVAIAISLATCLFVLLFNMQGSIFS